MLGLAVWEAAVFLIFFPCAGLHVAKFSITRVSPASLQHCLHFMAVLFAEWLLHVAFKAQLEHFKPAAQFISQKGFAVQVPGAECRKGSCWLDVMHGVGYVVEQCIAGAYICLAGGLVIRDVCDLIAGFVGVALGADVCCTLLLSCWCCSMLMCTALLGVDVSRAVVSVSVMSQLCLAIGSAC